jgi:hypothetical protein
MGKNFSWKTRRRPLWIRSCRWENMININLQEIGRQDLDWIHLAQNRDQSRDFIKTRMNFRVPHRAIEYLDYLSDHQL